MKNLVFFLIVFFTLLFVYLGTMGFFAFEKSLRTQRIQHVCVEETQPQMCKESLQ